MPRAIIRVQLISTQMYGGSIERNGNYTIKDNTVCSGVFPDVYFSRDLGRYIEHDYNV